MSAIKEIESRLPQGWEKQDLAASIQKHAENLAVAYVSRFVNAYKSRKVAIAGGLFANVRINQEIYQIEGVEKVFVHPGMTDCGLAVGSALMPCMRNRNGLTMERCRNVISDVYYGPEYSSKEIEQELKKEHLEFRKPESMAAKVASLLVKGYVVARFNGGMEYGPRALGNRSILYQPADPSVNDWLNKQLKRTEFMPFAPSTLIEYAGQCYEGYTGAMETARFMTITFDCTKKMKHTCSGVVHIDGTARPQLVAKKDNPLYYEIIDEFRKLTGVPTVINTSFNMHEEPIVCTPSDAVRAFRLGNLDYLSIGDFLVRSPEAVKHPLNAMPAIPVD